MMNDWKKSELGNIINFQRGFDLPIQRRIAGQFPIIASTGVVGTHNEYKVKGPGVVIGRSGSIGGGQFISKNFWPLNTTLWVKDFKGNDTRYCYYLIKNIDFSVYNVGSGVPTLNRNHIHPHPVMVAPSFEQKSIGAILGALDDKIENNHNMNKILEEIIRTIFKSWFVDFDPVHAKIAGNLPAHMDAHTASLFPNSLSDDGVPLGWKRSCISNFAFRVKDKFEKDQSWDNEKLIDLGRMPNNSISLNEYGEGKELSTSINIFKKNDFLFGSIRPYFCKAGIAPFDGVTNSSVFILRCYKNKNKEFLYALCSSKDIFNKSIQFSKGTKMPTISWTDFSKFECVDSTQIIRDKFSSVTLSMFKKIQKNILESQTLAKLRDTLLPKLMSGKIRLRDAEREVETVV